MLDVEAALARVQARLGIIPADAADAIAASRDATKTCDHRRTRRQRAQRRLSGGRPGRRPVARRRRRPARWTHWGATTQDIMDTATVLQVRDGLALIRTELPAILRALSPPRPTATATP